MISLKTMSRINLTLPFIFLANFTLAQCFTANEAFADGEEASYTVSYNWGPVWVDAGIVTFSAKRETVSNRSVWHLKSSGKTFPAYDFFFKVRDYYDSWVDPATFHSMKFQRYIYEGGYTLVNTLHFDYEKNLVFSSTKRNEEGVRHDTIQLLPCSFDMLAAVYYTRTLDLAGIGSEQKKVIPVIIDDLTYFIDVKSVNKEVVENLDGKKYRCIHFTARMVAGTIFKEGQDLQVWVTDDANKVPIRIEAAILVGSVKAFLKEVKGLRNPVTSEIR